MNDPPPTTTDGPPGHRDRAWPWLVALATAGAALAVVPHLVRWRRTGDPTYIADGDALLYLAWSRDIVRHGGAAMTDAIRRPSGPMMHPGLLFVPPAWIAYAFGLGMTGLGIVWRVLAGPALALALYAAVRPFTKTARGAAGLAAFLLFDAGLLLGEIVQREGKILASLARGMDDYLAGVPRLLPHLRVPTPALALPFLLAHFALAHRARRLATLGPALAAGASLGLLFHVYFYFATAAALGTILAWFLDRGGRKTYTLMLAAGAALAAPAVVAGAWIKAITPPDWLIRTEHFAPVERFDLASLIRPRLQILAWIGSALIVFRTRRDLIYLWVCTGAGLVLVNQHVITGFNLEDFHWSHAYGTALSLLMALLVLPWLGRTGRRGWVAAMVVAAQVAIGFGLRSVEATDSAESNYYLDMLGEWRREGLVIEPGTVVAGPYDLLLLLGAVEDVDPLAGRLVEYSSATTDEERDERDTLDLILIGLPRDRAEAEIEATAHLTAAQRAHRKDLLDTIAADPRPRVDKFRVGAIVTPSGLRPPAALGDRLELVKSGRSWDLWRTPPPRGFPGR